MGFEYICVSEYCINAVYLKLTQCYVSIVCACVCVLSRFNCVDSLQPYELQPTRLLCLWDSPGKNTRVSGLPHPPSGDLPNPGIEPISRMPRVLQVDSLQLSHWGDKAGGGRGNAWGRSYVKCSHHTYTYKERGRKGVNYQRTVRFTASFIMMVSQVHTYFEHMNTLIIMLYLQK